MVVCICNAVREKDLRGAARSGCVTPGKAYRHLGVRPKCGECATFARQVIASELGA